MSDVILAVAAIALLLVLVGLLLPLADRLRVPHTVLLALFGLALGLGVVALGEGPDPGPAADVLHGLRQLGLNAEAFLYLFLPPLLFTAALLIDVRRLLDEIWAVLLLAVVAVIVCTAFVGLALAPVADVGIVACLLLGAVVATTDPAAVVAVFRDLGAPRRLTILVEGESLFNDAAAIALFGILLGMLVGDRPLDFTTGTLAFLREFAGGVVLGYLVARGACAALPRLGGRLVGEITVTVGLAYLVFAVADQYLHVSGVVAVATAGLAFAAYGPTRLTPGHWDALVETWKQLEFWANALIVVLAAMLAARMLSDLQLADAGMLIVLVAATLAARALVLYGLLPGLTTLRLAEPVDGRYKTVILWGGLRGAVTLVLALAVGGHAGVPQPVQHFVGVLATGYVLFTLFVSAPTLRPLLRLLRLDRLSPTELFLRDRVTALSRAAIRERLRAMAEDHRFDPALLAKVAPPADEPEAADAEAEALDEAALTPDARLQVGLLTLAGREKELYLRHFDQRTISRRVVHLAVLWADRLLDRAKTGGAAGYEQVAREAVGHSTGLRAAHWLHRRFGWSASLAQRLADRFETLVVVQLVLGELAQFNRRAIRPLLGEATSAALDDVLASRRELVRQALAALELQYSSYAQTLRARYLARAALRFEEADYSQRLEERLISREVYNDLQRDLRARFNELDRRPPLDLGLRLMDMVRRVPLFRTLSQDRLAAVARLLKLRLAIPGERVVTKGAPGNAMYFIASGLVEVRLPSGAVRLGDGAFFGELALLTRQARNADVVAVGFCHLLVLDARDFRRLLRANPELRTEIEAVAQERLSVNAGGGGGD